LKLRVYLCGVNRQVNYIVSAHLTLALAIGTLFIANKLPATLLADEKTTEGFCGTADEPPLTPIAHAGKVLFENHCASCHKMGMPSTGPDLTGFEERGPWADRKKVYAWIRNPQSFMQKDNYVKELRKEYTTMMDGSPNLKDEEIDAIIAYMSHH
jgi:cytochrome c2